MKKSDTHYPFSTFYHFAKGTTTPRSFRPDKCDICKTPDKKTKQAYNTQGINCYMCAACLEKWNSYRKYHWLVDQSKLDVYCDTKGLTAYYMHDSDPLPPTPKQVDELTPISNRHKIKHLEYQRELARLQEGTP
jgi:hypothetical protein